MLDQDKKEKLLTNENLNIGNEINNPEISQSNNIDPKKGTTLEEHYRRSTFTEKLKEEHKKAIKRLVKICCFCATFMTIEFVGGYIAGSIAIMTDAAHLLSDLAGFLISMFSLFIATKQANKNLTYGYHRAEVIGALSSIMIIWILTVWLITEAIDRIFHPREILGLLMMGIATCGLIFNIIMSQILSYNPVPNAMEGKTFKDAQKEQQEITTANQEVDPEQGTEPILMGEQKEGAVQEKNDADNPVIRAAYIHILGDMIQSGGVLLAACIIYFFQASTPGIRIVDPICTFIFAIIVLCTTGPVSKQCIMVLMEAAPDDIDANKLYDELTGVIGVVDVHDMHLWCISVGRPAISIHMVSDKPQKSLEQATLVCKKYGIHHITIQVEDNTQIKRISYIACSHVEDNEVH